MAGHSIIWAVRAGALAAALALPGLAAAAPAKPAEASTVSELVVTAAKTVSELVVSAPGRCKTVDRMSTALNGPKVVSVYPQPGQTVRPGLLMVRITFDAPMACAGGLEDHIPLPNPCPETVQHLVLSYDRLTVRIICRVDPDTHYGAWLSHAPEHGFFSLGGVQARPFLMEFATSGEAPITGVCEAMSQDEDTRQLIEAQRPEACDQPPDDAGKIIAADVARLDAQARQAHALAQAEAAARLDKQRAELAARDLAEAERIARRSYAKAAQQARAETERAADGTRAGLGDRDTGDNAEESETSAVGARRDGHPEPPTFGARPRARSQTPSALAAWTTRISIDGRLFACGQTAGQVICVAQ